MAGDASPNRGAAETIDRRVLTWEAPAPLRRERIEGRDIRLEPVDPTMHAEQLFAAAQGPDSDPALWEYMHYGPFGDVDAFTSWLTERAASADPLFYALVDTHTGAAVGMASYLRMDPPNGVVEIGHIWFGAGLQRTRAATEAIYLLARHIFDGGYRRLEWKCDAANVRSRRAAERFGFTFEGIFRQHMVVKGRNRDTAWFAMLDGDWPRLRAAFEAWLGPENFEGDKQRKSLEAIRASLDGG